MVKEAKDNFTRSVEITGPITAHGMITIRGRSLSRNFKASTKPRYFVLQCSDRKAVKHSLQSSNERCGQSADDVAVPTTTMTRKMGSELKHRSLW